MIQAKFKSRFAERCVAARSIQAVARRRMTKRSVRAEILRRVDLVFGGQPEGQWRRTVVFSENAFLLKGCPMLRPMLQPRLLDEVMRDASFYGMRRYATELRPGRSSAARCVQSAWRQWHYTRAFHMCIRVIRIQRHWKGIVHRANVNFLSHFVRGAMVDDALRARADSIHRLCNSAVLSILETFLSSRGFQILSTIRASRVANLRCNAATRVQGWYRRRVSIAVIEARLRLERAATLIQRTFRTFSRYMEDVAEKMWAAEIIEAWYMKCLRQQRLLSAVVLIQSTIRRYLWMTSLERLRAIRNAEAHAAVVVQAWWRGWRWRVLPRWEGRFIGCGGITSFRAGLAQ